MPSQMRYAAPTSRNASYAVSDAASTAAIPAADASAQATQPALIPSVVANAARLPPMNTLRATIAMSAPGVIVRSAITPRKTNGSRTDSA
jgi:hypothetical protein